jgi:hypothetical protein
LSDLGQAAAIVSTRAAQLSISFVSIPERQSLRPTKMLHESNQRPPFLSDPITKRNEWMNQPLPLPRSPMTRYIRQVHLLFYAFLSFLFSLEINLNFNVQTLIKTSSAVWKTSERTQPDIIHSMVKDLADRIHACIFHNARLPSRSSNDIKLRSS